MAYGARLESVLGESPRGFESPILREQHPRSIIQQQDPRSSIQQQNSTTTSQRPGPPGRSPGRGHVTEKTVVSVRPRRSLITTGFISVVLGMIPLFGVLYWFSIEHDSWGVVFVVHLIVTALCLLAIVRQLTVYSAVTGTELVVRGIFSPLIRVPLDKIAAVHLVETYVGQAPESVTQLLVTDDEGKRLFRMRGNFYRDGDLKAIAAALPVTAQVVAEPIGISEFFRTYPGSAYWFEHRPILWIVVFAVSLAVAIAVAAWVMTILGMPVGLAG